MPRARPLRILIPGGTGRLGILLARHFHESGHVVSAITRFPKPREWEAIHWDAETVGDWASSFEGADVVINLAGKSMDCRYTELNRKSLLRSRVHTTELVGQAISQCLRPPRVWLNASTVDIYPDIQARDLDETSELPNNGDFCSEVAQAAEAAAFSAANPQTRKICFRLSAVMSPYSGFKFDRLLRLVRWGLGGEIGNGEQYVGWVHDFDFLRAMEFLIEREDLEGAINITAPFPIPNHQFMCNLRRAWCTSYFGLNMPQWLVEATYFALGREPEGVLKSRRVVPTRLLNADFVFHFPEWRGACENLVERWRTLHSV